MSMLDWNGYRRQLSAEIAENVTASYIAIMLELAALGSIWRGTDRVWQPPDFVAQWICICAGMVWAILVALWGLKIFVSRLEPWLGREGSNLRMAESKSAALPLGYAPTGP
jgi:hypothetical protein